MLRKSTGLINNHPGSSRIRFISSLILPVCLWLFWFPATTAAEVTWSGDVDPDTDPITWISSTWAYIGKTGVGTMDVTDGSSVLNYGGTIGCYSGSTGEVTVDGSGSTWTNSLRLHVGLHGSGVLNITDGGVVTVEEETKVAYNFDSSGSINFDNGTLTTGSFLCGIDDVTGTGTINTGGLVSDVNLVFDAANGLNQTFNINDNPGQNITVNLNVDGFGLMGAGYSGVGTMNISDGKIIESTSGYIGYKSGSTGTVTVDGPGSTWTNSDSRPYYGLHVGYFGNGTLNITDGGVVSNFSGHIGRFSGSMGEVTVDGAGSTWTNSDNLYIGGGNAIDPTNSNGHGTLNITGGGVVISRHVFIADDPGSTGVVNMDGPGSTWMGGDHLSIGGYGRGVLNITNGGAVICDTGGITAEMDTMSEATVDGVGSTWTASVGIYIGGILNITGGGYVTSVTGTIANYWDSTGEVTVDGIGSTWMNSGNLFVEHYFVPYMDDGGNGVLNITEGGLVSVGGVLTVDDYNDGDDFVNMASGGMLALNAVADASGSLAEFLGLIDGSDAIRYWDYALGDWADIAEAALGVDYTLDYIIDGELAGYTMLTVLEQALLVGDANRDGVVSASDYAAVQANFGNVGIAGIHGDANGDGVVSASDYASVQTNYGNIAAGGETSITPEPTTMLLLIFGGVMAVISRKRK